MLLMNAKADKQGRQEREYIRLEKTDENFEQVHRQRKGDGQGGDIERFENKNNADQGQDDHMPGQHIGKEADAQGKRLGQQAQEFQRNHEGQQCDRQVGGDHALKKAEKAVVLDARAEHDDK